MNNWNSKSIKKILLYAVLYAVLSAIVCFTGAIHPIFFVLYQITAGILLSGVIICAFETIKGPGAAVCLGLAMIILFVVIGDAVPWHVIPLIVIAVAAEIVRATFHYTWNGDVLAAVIMSFSTFGYYGQIWFNRAYTYECAIEEMPAGYGDALMACSPGWALPAVMIAGAVICVLCINLTAKLFKIEKD